MPRRVADFSREDNSSTLVPTVPASPCSDLRHGELLKDLSGKQWRLGKTVGVGGFGEIFLVGEKFGEVKADTPYVAKIESHSNGPLFVEINCYLRIAKLEMIEAWKREKNLDTLGMPHYIASGSHINRSNKYRFLIIPRFERDLERIFKTKRKFNIKTVLTIACQILDVLEYMHSKGYIHSDIKASNILIGSSQQAKTLASTQRVLRTNRYPGCHPIRTCRARRMQRIGRNLRPVPSVNYVDDIPFIEEILENDQTEPVEPTPEKSRDQVYLVDFGLAAKYVGSDGQHKDFCVDERKAHAGTVLFCSRDAHKGIVSRRSDLESLAYNMVYWLTGTLPWYENVQEPDIVDKKKQRCFANLGLFLQSAFPEACPKFIHEYFTYLNNLKFDSEPDYVYCKSVFVKALRDYGYKNDQRLDFENLEGWGRKQKKMKRNCENKRNTRATLIIGPHRLPLHSNNVSLIKPLLRKKVKNCKMNSMMNWSKILVQDPEVILKQANKGRERKNTENCEGGNVLHLDLDQLNPTYAMIDVVARCRERGGVSPTDRGDSIAPAVEGYTPAMMAIYNRIKEREEYELNHTPQTNTRASRTPKPRAVKRKYSDSQSEKKLKKVRASKSTAEVVVQLECLPTRKVKVVPLKRTYSLRG